MTKETGRDRIEVATLYTGNIRRYGEIAERVMAAYCARHGYQFTCRREPLLAEAAPPWSKVPALLEAFEAGAEWACWMDADSLILNPEVKLETFTEHNRDVVLTAGLEGLNSGVMLLRNCEFSKNLLAGLLSLRGERAAAYREQDALREIYAGQEGARGRFLILEERSLCSRIGNYGFSDFILHLAGMGELARFQYMKSLYSRVYRKNKVYKTAAHGGDMGDVVYSVPLFRELGINKVVLNPQSPYRTKMNAGACAALKPLLEKQGFAVEIDGNYPENGVDFYTDIFREGANDMENNHLSVTNSEKLVSGLDLSRKYLEAEPKRVADVVLNRSARYRNPDFDWLYLLGDLPAETTAAFVGLKGEYDAFCRATGLGSRVFYYPTADLYEAARVIAGAKVFIGNQSSPYALAEGLKVNRIQETCLYTPNCRAQSDNGVDVKSRYDLYGAKVKLFDWLGLPGEVPPPARKVLLYTTCYVSDEYQFRRVCGWLDYYLPRLEKLGATGVALIDDGSPAKWAAELKARYKDLNLAPVREIKEKGAGGYEIPGSVASSGLSLVSFPDRLGRPTEDLFPGWWRSYSFGAVLAEFFNFEKFIFIESDAYLYTDRLFNWVRNTSSGLNSLYSRGLKIREPGVQVCARSEFHRVAGYFRTNTLNDKFWWGAGLTRAQYLPEHVLPFTNRLDEVRQFRIDRYGDDACADLPEDADGCCNLTDISLGHKYHKRERKKLYQHCLALEKAEAGEKAGSAA